MAALWIGFFRFHGLLAGAPAPGAPPVPGRVLLVHAGTVWDADRAVRRAGARPGQGAAEARLACPEATWRTFDPGAAAPVLRQAWDLLAEAAAVVEPDPEGRPEAFAAWRTGDPPVREVAALRASVAARWPHVDLAGGLGPSRLVARLACPPGGGVAVVAPERAARFMEAQPLQVLVDEGLVAPVLRARLEFLGLRRCGQVAALPAAILQARFGPEGRHLRALARGGDGRPVRALHPPRAVSARRAFPEGLPPQGWPAAAAEVARQAALRLGVAEGARRLVLAGSFGSAERTWGLPRRDAGLLARAAALLAERAARGSPGAEPADFLAVRLEDLAVSPPRPLSLFGDGAGAQRARAVLDEIRVRLPRARLRRGWGQPDRYEALIGLLDPWWAAP